MLTISNPENIANITSQVLCIVFPLYDSRETFSQVLSALRHL